MTRYGTRAKRLAIALLGASLLSQVGDIPAHAAPSANPGPAALQSDAEIQRLTDAFANARNAERNQEALEALDALGPLIERQSGRASRAMAEHLGYRANTFQALGRVAEAETAGGDALRIARALVPADTAMVADSLNTLAAVYLTEGSVPETRRLRAREAERLLTEATALLIDRPQGGSETLDTVSNNLAAALIVLERLDEAIARLEALREARAATFGPDDALSLGLTSNLGLLYAGAGRYEDGERLLAGVAETRRRDARTAPAALAFSLGNLGRTTLLPENAQAAFRDAVEIYHTLGCREPETRRAAATAAGYGAYRWAGQGVDCPGDLRLVDAVAGQGGFAYVERNRLARPYTSLRLLAHAGDLVIGHTRATYASNPIARRQFADYRLVHREFITSAWMVAGTE